MPRDSRRVKAVQNADPLVALLDVEAAQVFIAPDGIPDALIAQMCFTEVDPLGGKFRIFVQKRKKVGGKGILPAFAFGSHDLLSGNFNDAKVYPSGDHGVVQNFIQDLKIRVLSVQNSLLVARFAGLQCFPILITCVLSSHRRSPPSF